jgi:D-alanyl-lipoteichoic acid acyltransferase DltB (MBOAT superfamily)
LFVLVLAIVYYTIGKKRQWVVLLAASLLYYYVLSRGGIIYLLVNTVSTYLGARILDSLEASFAAKKKGPSLDRAARKALKASVQKKKRVILVSVLLFNLAILARLKYWNEIFPSAKTLLLPLGISFYTFMSISYLVDVCNEKYQAEKNFAKYLLYISWFPQVIQGPIGRFDAMAPQFEEKHTFSREKTARALLLILFGLMKKYAIADMLTDDISALFDGPVDSLPGSVIVFGILLYSAQQYADFSGGIDIITGVSEIFGIELAPNFRQPYFSVSLGDFWRRWHISLGAFMRDYVFYPFALLKPMQRLGKWCTKHLGKHAGRVLPAGIANILVFLVVGLWHGAQMHYILWGLYNGVVIALSDLTQPFWQKLNQVFHFKTESSGFYIFRIIRTFIIVNIGWYFDRITDFRSCMTCFRNTLLYFAPSRFVSSLSQELFTGTKPVSVLGGFVTALIGCVIVFAVSLQKEKGIDVAGTILGHKKETEASGRLLRLKNGMDASGEFLRHNNGMDASGVLLWQGNEMGVSGKFLRQKNILFMSTVTILFLLVLVSFLFTTSAGGFMYANF